jgi:hypothetical protein
MSTVLGNCTAHERFSIMLQERLDDELQELLQDLRTVKCQIAASERRACVWHKRSQMRMMLTCYMAMFPNHTSSPTHYLRSLHKDMQLFMQNRNNNNNNNNTKTVLLVTEGILEAAAAGQVTKASVSSKNMLVDEIAQDIAKPFLNARRRKSTGRILPMGDQSTLNPGSSRANCMELEARLLDIARLCALCPDDVLTEFVSDASDMPDLTSDDDDDEDQQNQE